MFYIAYCVYALKHRNPHVLLTFLESTELPRSDARRHAFLNLFSAYDFTRSNQGRLVHSLSGKFSTQAVDRGREGGLISLAGAVGDLKSFEGGDWNLECMVSRRRLHKGGIRVERLIFSQGSSSGRLPRSFLEDLFTAAQGFEPRKRHGTKNAHLLARFDPAKIKVVFPCEADLSDSSDRGSVCDRLPSSSEQSFLLLLRFLCRLSMSTTGTMDRMARWQTTTCAPRCFIALA